MRSVVLEILLWYLMITLYSFSIFNKITEMSNWSMLSQETMHLMQT